jgi:hypothetical protein
MNREGDHLSYISNLGTDRDIQSVADETRGLGDIRRRNHGEHS